MITLRVGDKVRVATEDHYNSGVYIAAVECNGDVTLTNGLTVKQKLINMLEVLREYGQENIQGISYGGCHRPRSSDGRKN